MTVQENTQGAISDAMDVAENVVRIMHETAFSYDGNALGFLGN